MQWAAFIGIVVTVGGVLIINFMSLRSCGCLVAYLICFAIMIAYAVWNSKRLAPERSIHIHHYVCAGVVALFVGYQSPVLTFASGFAMGTFIEGGARWGYDPIWTWNEYEVDDEEITKPDAVKRHSKPERQRWIRIKSHQSKARINNEK